MPEMSKDGTSVKEMVLGFLKANGYDGLCNPDAECGCSKDDLFACGNYQYGDCVCAYKGKPPASEADDYDEWFYINQSDAEE